MLREAILSLFATCHLVLLESFGALLLRCTLILHGVPCNPEQDALQNLEQRLDAELAKVREREPTPTLLKAEGGVSSDLFARPRLRPTAMQADRRVWGDY